MESFTEIVPQIVLRIFAPLLGACILAWVLLQLHSFKSRMWSKLRRVVCAGLISLAIACTTLIGKNTNGVNGVGGMYLMQFNPPVVQSVTPENISNGWRVAEVSDAGAFAPPPPNAVTNERWRLRGAYDDAFRIPADGWNYPFASGVTVLSRGEIRRDIRTHDFPPAFDQDLSLVPNVNWALLPEGRQESVFWHGSTPSNTLIATWWNAALGRNATNPICFQAELYTNGGFDYRYEDRTVRHVRVWPFDLDDDGLENSVDPDPLVAGPDAHGTNAEWYNTVCSNVLEAVAATSAALPPELTWREGVNSNAYYFVDVVASNGPAPIYFTGDRESRLGNPVVVARAFETNHVPLLIGIDYAVTSTVPFTVSLPDEGFAAITTNGVSSYEVRWPLNFVFTESIGESNRVYTVTVEPYDPGGVLTWEGGGMRSGTSPGCGCGCLGCVGFSVLYSCPVTCTCNGACQAVGGYAFEDTLFAVTGGVCRCGFDDPVEAGGGTETTNAPSISVSFSKPAVIFEDAYEDKSGVTKPRRSSRVRITVDAYGGAFGGAVSVSSANLDKLTPVGGGVALPIVDHVIAAGTHFYVTGVYEGAAASGSDNDVTLNGTFTEYFTSQQYQSSNSLTVVKVELRPHVIAPNNDSINRHKYGVRELVQHIQEPLAPAVTWNPVGGGSNETVGLHVYYRCPLDACTNPLRAEIGSVTYPFSVDVVEPDGMESKVFDTVVCSNAVHKGEAGGIGMKLYLYVTPLDVSFSEIAVQEVPCFTYTVEGYFENPYFNGVFAHTGGQWGAGAGRWSNVNVADNRLRFYDTAAYEEKIPWLTPSGTPTTNSAYAWTEGHAYMDTPLGWNITDTSGNTPPYKQFGEGLQQVFRIDRHGRVGVFKLDNWVTRTTNDVVTIFGPRTEKQ